MTHHITDEQTSEALRLSDALEDMACIWSPSDNRDLVNRAAAELRRLALAAPAPQGEPFGYVAGSLTWGQRQSEKVIKLTRNAQPEHGFVHLLYTAPAPAVPSDEREAFIYWLATTYPKVYSPSDAAQYWDNRHVSALAWQRRAALTAAPTPTAQHPDDAAVDRFAIAMKAKLAASRANGRGGWDDPAQCSVEYLARLLVEHIAKGDPVDVANFAMMLHQRGADRAVLASAQQTAVPSVDVTPEMLRAAQMRTELGAYACANMSSAYTLITELFQNMLAASPASAQPAVPEDVARVNTQMLEALEDVLPDLPSWHVTMVEAAIDAARKAGGA